jgi:hypothetical protein
MRKGGMLCIIDYRPKRAGMRVGEACIGSREFNFGMCPVGARQPLANRLVKAVSTSGLAEAWPELSLQAETRGGGMNDS